MVRVLVKSWWPSRLGVLVKVMVVIRLRHKTKHGPENDSQSEPRSGVEGKFKEAKKGAGSF